MSEIMANLKSFQMHIKKPYSSAPRELLTVTS